MKRRFKKTFKLFAYVLLYLFISLGTAYGVINLSIHNASIASTANSKNSGASVPIQLKNIVTNISSQSNILLNAEAIILTDSEKLVIDINDASIYLQEGISNLEVQGNIDISLENQKQETNIYLAYENHVAYFSMFNNNFKLSTDNLFSSLTGIMEALNLPGLGGFNLSSLNIDTILGLFSDLTETKTENEIVLEIKIPVIDQDAFITCDKNYYIKSLSVPSLKISGTEVQIQLDVEYPEEKAEIVLPEVEFLDLTSVVEASENILSVLNKDLITFEFTLETDRGNFVGTFTLEKETFNFKITFHLSRGDLNLILIDDTLYVEFCKYYGKIDITDKEAMIETFNLSFVDEPKQEFLPLLKEKGFAAIFDILAKVNIPLDLSSIDLDFLKSVETSEGNITITTTNSIIDIATTKDGFNLSLEVGTLKMSFSAADGEEITLRKNEARYVPLEDVLPDIINGIGSLTIKIGKLSIELQIGNIIFSLFGIAIML